MLCPSCGASIEESRATCWLCHAELPRGPGAAAEHAPTVQHRRVDRTFGLSSVMLFIALVAVCLGLLREAPGLGIALAVMATPALIRTRAATARRRADGQHVTIADKLLAFAGSLGVVALTGAAAGAAFFTTCWAGFFGGAATSSLWASGYGQFGWGMVTGYSLGGIAGLWVFVWLLRRFWPIRK